VKNPSLRRPKSFLPAFSGRSAAVLRCALLAALAAGAAAAWRPGMAASLTPAQRAALEAQRAAIEAQKQAALEAQRRLLAEYRQAVADRGANAVAMGQTASIMLLDTELGTVAQRQGELRTRPERGGFWLRGAASGYQVETADASAFDQDASAVSAGADYAWAGQAGTLYLGGFVGMSRSGQDAEFGTHGKIDSRYAGIYLSYEHQSGLYLDVVNKVGRIEQDVRFDLPLDRGEYADNVSHTTYSGSIETGYHWNLGSGWFVEPQLQGIYTRSSQTSVQGRAGLRAGRSIALQQGGVMQPYVKASYLKQFSHDDTVSFGNTDYHVALPGNRWQLGGGLGVESGRHGAFVDVQYGHGASVSHELTASIGYRFRF